jgi:hypothetical protein
MRDIQRDRCNVVVKLLWEAIGKASEPALPHAERKVLRKARREAGTK